LLYNVVGALFWVGICVGAGYFFGGIEAVRKHFELVVLAIILLSVLPVLFEVLSHHRSRGKIIVATPRSSVGD
jgi:membrane-associated protein